MDLNCYIYLYIYIIMKKCGIIENVNNNKYKLYPSLLKRKKEQTKKHVQKQKALFFFPH